MVGIGNRFKILSLGIIILCTKLFGCEDVFFNNCIDIIKENWDIQISAPTEEIFHESSSISFHGDGERYHVFEYENEEDIINSSIQWIDYRDNSINAKVQDIIYDLETYYDVKIPEKFRPNIKDKYKFYTISKDDNSNLYLVYIPGTSRIFVAEDIF